MSKRAKSVIGIFTETLGLYFINLDKFLKYMTFPVIGQIAGLGLTFFIAYFYALNMPKLIVKYPNLNSFGTLVIILILISLPGIAIFCKAFWEYLVSYGAINSMFINLLKSRKLYDFEAHTELIKRRAASFIGLWLIISIFTILAICPLLWIICAILAIYFILVFQVFTYEPELSPVRCFKKSLMLIKGNFAQTVGLLALVGFLTYLVIPQIITKGLEAVGIMSALSGFIKPFMTMFHELDLTQFGVDTVIDNNIMALIVVQAIITQIIIQYTLPLRSLLWSNWYKELNDGIPVQGMKSKQTKSKNLSKKRLSEKLMEKTHKKYASKKIDSNIIKRAMEKEEDE